MPSHLQLRQGMHSTTSQRTFLARHPRQARAARRCSRLRARAAVAAAAAFSEEAISSVSPEMIGGEVVGIISSSVDFAELQFDRRTSKSSSIHMVLVMTWDVGEDVRCGVLQGGQTDSLNAGGVLGRN